jgi:hypothetical protein
MIPHNLKKKIWKVGDKIISAFFVLFDIALPEIVFMLHNIPCVKHCIYKTMYHSLMIMYLCEEGTIVLIIVSKFYVTNIDQTVINFFANLADFDI